MSRLQGMEARAARGIYADFLRFRSEFDSITARARQRFEQRDWDGDQRDAAERLDLYARIMDEVVLRLSEGLGVAIDDREAWKAIKDEFAALASPDRNRELAFTFYNSATRRIFATVGVDPGIEFLEEPATDDARSDAEQAWFQFSGRATTAELILDVLEAHRFRVPYRQIGQDAILAAEPLDARLRATFGTSRIDSIETIQHPLFRDRAAYIVGRVRQGAKLVPLVLALRNTPGGIRVDAVLTRPNEVSILFSFARAYFRTESSCPRELITFIRSVLPLKPIAELYIALGFNKHGKTVLYRDLQRHLQTGEPRFEVADGTPGMVMLVFTLPGFDVVFKVIRDRFDYPKKITRKQVLDRYRLVFEHDRVGRLVDAQEFEHLSFHRRLFDEELLEQLLSQASRTVVLDGDCVTIRHLYTERQVMPLDLYLRRATWDQAKRAVYEYGVAIKDLAAANVFPGDFLLKNFGVTRHGRVVFYDYDELCPLTECHFRRLPEPRYAEEEMEAEPWFTVGEHDIFPEEFQRFLGLPEALRVRFTRAHADLFGVEFWLGVQDRHRRGDAPDFFPYPEEKRLPAVVGGPREAGTDPRGTPLRPLRHHGSDL